MTDERRLQIELMTCVQIANLTQADWNTWTREELDLLTLVQRQAIEASVELPV